jgi:DNA mismatch endonuclease, patch repair protein
MGSGASSSPTHRMVTLSGGVVVPYPEPANAAATKIGKANHRADTKAEVALRSMLQKRGLRFRKDQLIRCSNGVKVRPDVVFTRSFVAVFVDGCFWHGCPNHQRVPQRNRDYWVPKLQANHDRDRRVDEALRQDGWLVERVWEHEDPEQAAERIEGLVRLRNGRSQTSRS